MSRWHSFAGAAGLAVLSTFAQAGTTGAFPDGSLQVGPGGGVVNRIYLTEWWGHTSNGTQVGGSDLLFWDGGPWGTLVLYDARIFVTTPDPDPGPGTPVDVVLTTVYGKHGADGGFTGFDPGGTEFIPRSPETHRSRTDPSGPTFTSFSSAAVAAMDLAAYLPGYDLNGFDTGSSQVYQVFKTSVPLSVLTVPEPATVALWLAGLAGLGALRRRQTV